MSLPNPNCPHADPCVLNQPNGPGVHICGAHDTPDGRDHPYTAACFPFPDQESAHRAWLTAKSECESAAGEPQDFIVDYFSEESTIDDDFAITRQMLERCIGVLQREAGG